MISDTQPGRPDNDPEAHRARDDNADAAGAAAANGGDSDADSYSQAEGGLNRGAGVSDVQAGYEAPPKISAPATPGPFRLPFGDDAADAQTDDTESEAAADTETKAEADPAPDTMGEGTDHDHKANADNGGESRSAGSAAQAAAMAPINVNVVEVADVDVPAACFDYARRPNWMVFAMLGLAGTGKSFFVQRLYTILRQHYGVSNLAGKTVTFADGTLDRTNNVCAYRFMPTSEDSSETSFLILDLPGERFEEIVKKITATGEPTRGFGVEREAAIAVPLALASAMIFVIPAFQYLNSRDYERDGDVQGLSIAERKQRTTELKDFVYGLQTFRNLVLPLRRAAKTAVDVHRLRALIRETLENRLEDHREPLDLPALVLLSRADEYQTKLGEAQRADYDQDPLLHIVERRPELVTYIGTQFREFKFDFMTADFDATKFEFDSNHEHFGVDGIVQDWLEPAVKSSEKRWWTRLFAPASAAEVLRARAAKDRAFKKVFNT